MTPLFEKQLRKLKGALRTLDGTEGRAIARRNARKRVLGALRTIRGALDYDFPAIVDRTGVKRLTPEGRQARLKRAGWVSTGGVDVGPFAAAKVPVRMLKERGTAFPGSDTVTAVTYYVPRWAWLIYHEVGSLKAAAALKAANKDRVLQQAALAKAALLK